MRALVGLGLVALMFPACRMPMMHAFPQTGLPPHVPVQSPVTPAHKPETRAPREPSMPMTTTAPPRPSILSPPALPATRDPFELPANHQPTSTAPEPVHAYNSPEAHYQRFVAAMESAKGELTWQDAEAFWGKPQTAEADGNLLLATWTARDPTLPQQSMSRPALWNLLCWFDRLGRLRRWMLTPSQFTPTPTSTPAELR